MRIFKYFIPIFSIILLINTLISINIYRYNNQIIQIKTIINNNESIYILNKGSKFSDLLNLLKIDENIDFSQYSFNEPLFDGQIIVLNTNSINKISINTANVDELVILPGIGIKIANRIIEYRDINNGFKYLEEIKNVNGIGDKKYEEIKEKISL